MSQRQDCGTFGADEYVGACVAQLLLARMRQFVNDYINTCETCARNKVPRHRPHGLLPPLPIPTDAWKSVSMDLIVELPPSGGFDAIFMCVNRFTKIAHFVATTSNVTAEQAARLYLWNVFRLHGLPSNIVSDRGQQFTSRFTQRLLDLCDIKRNWSTAYHPQSDSQTEWTNQTLEQYLRIYCDYQQDDWHELLPYAEFVYNNTQNASTQLTPFFANQGGKWSDTIPAILFPFLHLRSRLTPPPKSSSRNSANFIKSSMTTCSMPNSSIRSTTSHMPSPRRHLRLETKSGSTDSISARIVKRMGPFRIEETVGESKPICRLQLPPQMHIHPVFHVSLLEPYKESRFTSRTQARPPLMEVEGELEYEVKEIVDSNFVGGCSIMWSG